MTNLLDRWNQQYFHGRLAPEVLEHLRDLPGQSAEVHAFVERIFRFMNHAKYPAEDFSVLLAWAIGFLPSRVLPGAWGGLVPPITLEGRHTKINEYLARNPWHPLGSGATLLDLGCGFPPLTTIDTAKAFPDWRITGADPSFGKYIIYDEHNDYACIRSDGSIRYFQPSIMDFGRWESLYQDQVATRAHFSELFAKLRGNLDGVDSGEMSVVEQDGGRLVRNPLRSYETKNLSFQEGGIGDVSIENLDAVRCMNVLMYFDSDARMKARDWIAQILKPNGIFICGVNWFKSTNSRYTVFRKENEHLAAKEFSFSIDNIRTLQIVTWFALHDTDDETCRLAEALRVLRSDVDFLRDFDQALDRIFALHQICARKPDGYLGGISEDITPAELERRLSAAESEIASEGFGEKAVKVLQNAGYDAWLNCVGHISITPA